MQTLCVKQLNEVRDFMNKDVDALLATLEFIQKTKSRSNYVYNQV